MDQQAERWTVVDEYLEGLVLDDDPALESALDAAAAAGLPQIQVSRLQGRLLQLLVGITGARRVLEVGTLGGYSAICMARALPSGGSVVSLELDEHHAEVARDSIARAGLEEAVEIRVGPALDTLPGLEQEGRGPFDLVFIDADKANSAKYFEWGITLGHPGTVIVLDNAVRRGAVADAENNDADVVGTRMALERMGKEPSVSATVIQTVGTKGYDGFALAVVRATSR